MTRDDFLRAVLADPDDDSPRLAYADWLDEFEPSNPARFLAARRGPFKGWRLALVAARWLPPGYNRA